MVMLFHFPKLLLSHLPSGANNRPKGFLFHLQDEEPRARVLPRMAALAGSPPSFLPSICPTIPEHP